MSSEWQKEALSRVTIFAGIDERSIDRFFTDSDFIERPANQVLINEDTQAEEIYIVLEGYLKVFLNLHNDPLELVEIGPGKIVGESSVIGIQNHSASVVTTTPVKLFVLTRKTLMRINAEDPVLFGQLILNIARELARRLSATNKIVLSFQQKARKA